MARGKIWLHPQTGIPIEVGEQIHIDASARLGPSAVGVFVVVGLTDEGITGVPAGDAGANRQVRFQPSDIVKQSATQWFEVKQTPAPGVIAEDMKPPENRPPLR